MSCIDHGRTKSLRPEGYALVGSPGTHSTSVDLHRLVYCEANALSLGDIAGKCVRHTCDNPRCINPDHLLLGSWADNNRDRAERKRSAKVVPSRQRLTREQVEAIKLRYSPKRVGVSAPDGVTALAKDYAVDTNVIYKVLRGTYVASN